MRFIDDLDGSEASGTFDFSLDGRDYQIDLSDDNAAKLRDALSPSLGGARKASGRGVEPCEETHAIRAWARQNGHQMSDAGVSRSRSSTPTKPITEFVGSAGCPCSPLPTSGPPRCDHMFADAPGDHGWAALRHP